MKGLYDHKYEEIKKTLSADKNEKLRVLKFRLGKETNKSQIDVISQEIYKVEDKYQNQLADIESRINLDEIFAAKLDSAITQKENELSELKSIELDRHKK